MIKKIRFEISELLKIVRTQLLIWKDKDSNFEGEKMKNRNFLNHVMAVFKMIRILNILR